MAEPRIATQWLLSVVALGRSDLGQSCWLQLRLTLDSRRSPLSEFSTAK